MKELLKLQAVPVLLTVFMLVLVSFFSGKVGFDLTVLVFIVTSFQVFLTLYPKVIQKFTPLKVLNSNQSKFKIDNFSTGIVFSLSLIPLISYVNLNFGWLVFIAFMLWGVALFIKLLFIFRNQSKLITGELKKITKTNPLVAIHVSVGESKSAYQINQWLMVLEKLSVPVVIILREHEVFDQMYATSLPVVYARNIEHVEQVLNTGVRTVLYPANGQKNAAVLRAYKLNHFFINHGESDKAVNQSKFLMAYDKLLVSGPLAERRLYDSGLPVRPGQIVQVGRPQTELVLNRAKTDAPLQTILYAPTWEGFVDSVNYSSIGSFSLDRLTLIFSTKKYKIIFKPHPFTGRRCAYLRQELSRIKALCKQYGHEYVSPEVSILELMNRSDLLITDVSSVLNDYLATHKPLVLCVTKKLEKHDIEHEFPSSNAAYLLRENGTKNVLDLLDAISISDEMAVRREAIRSDSLGDFEQGSFACFNEVVTSSVQE